jgi:hypothetical protein
LRIKSSKRYPRELLFSALRNVRLMGNNRDTFPYEHATFEVKMTSPSDLQPSAFYVLKEGLSFISHLTEILSEQLGGVERLDTLVEYVDGHGNTHRMIPPVVERTDFHEWMILDGIHRSYLALVREQSIPMLFVKNVTVPYPCLPLPNGWESVELADRVPAIKRLVRSGFNDTAETYHDLHRDLREFGSMGSRPPALRSAS